MDPVVPSRAQTHYVQVLIIAPIRRTLYVQRQNRERTLRSPSERKPKGPRLSDIIGGFRQ
jgi:hypothetical protein